MHIDYFALAIWAHLRPTLPCL